MKRYFLLAFSLLCASICVSPVDAIYESQAGVFDWHHSWVGKPHWTAQYQHESSSHIIISTDRNVLASLNALTGEIEWRQLLENSIKRPQLTSQGIVTVHENAQHVQLWDIKTGRLIWRHSLTSNTKGNNSNDVLVLSGDQGVIVLGDDKVYKLAVATGDIDWETEIPAKSGSVGGHTLQQGDGLVHVVALPELDDKASYFHIFGLDQTTGELLHSDVRLSSHATTRTPLLHGDTLVWKEKDTLKWNTLGTKKVHQASLKNLLGSSSSFSSVLDPEYQLSTTQGAHSGDVFFIHAKNEAEGPDGMVATGALAFSDDGKSVELVKDLGIQKSFGATTKYDGNVLRFTRKDPLNLAIDEFGSAKSYSLQEIAFDNGLADDIVSGLILPSSLTMVSTSSGSIYMLKNNIIKWSREEALAHTTAAELLELPEKQKWTQVDEDEVTQSAHGDHQQNQSPLARYIRRLTTHAAQLQNLPSWLVHHFIDMGKPMLTTSTAGDITALQAQSCWSPSSDNTQQEHLYRDSFGMRKLLVSVTSTGKIIGQDSGRRGKIIWTRYMEGVTFEQVYVVRTAAVKLPPVIVALGTSNEGATTHLYRLNGLTGQDYVTTSTDADVQDAFDPQLMTETSLAKVMVLPLEEPDEHTHVLALFDAATTRVFIYPGTDGARLVTKPFWSKFYFQHPFTPSTTNQQQQQQQSVGLKGYQVVEGYRGSLTAQPVWNMILPQGEQLLIVDGQRQHHQAASIGRVLGNRNVFYKYLNPNMFTILAGDAEQETLTVRVVDAVKGTILYEAVHHHVPASSFATSVHMVQMENWIVYHFWSNDGKDTGYQAVVLELYEGSLENQRVPSTNFSSFDPLQPSIQSAAFAFPYPVQAMGVTTTRNGVSTRDILFALPSHQILTVNKRLLDPRRPTNAPTKEDQEEQLLPYAPIPEERKMFLTYNLEVIGIQHIISAPALLESTSLVYAYGLDSYFSRDSPSRQFDVLSEDFSKSQLLLTIIALVIGILVAGPIVRRKQVNALWQ
ncbi:hypothetical protein BCR42DRAFT_42767 [Absidia repens]|uniref:ER membrane protein complex subunit 1 n=1 Tax=Absidia repens TaxID=90262 RepID=A0A1X2IG45_9FUNG|nr:hypothetical protein BCR42DRAFT_42767 [Absidia repens]